MNELRWIRRKSNQNKFPDAMGVVYQSTYPVLQQLMGRRDGLFLEEKDWFWQDVPTVDEDGS